MSYPRSGIERDRAARDRYRRRACTRAPFGLGDAAVWGYNRSATNDAMIMPGPSEFAKRRWLSICLRSLHLVGVVLTAMAIYGGGPHQLAAATTFVTGVGLFGIEMWRSREHWRELAGAFVMLKLLLVLAMILMPRHAAALFWFLLISSSLVSHAPKSVRHKRLFG